MVIAERTLQSRRGRMLALRARRLAANKGIIGMAELSSERQGKP